jgi:hypothetical protein
MVVMPQQQRLIQSFVNSAILKVMSSLFLQAIVMRLSGLAHWKLPLEPTIGN